MQRGRSEIKVNMSKLLKLKPLVDDKLLEIGDACKILDISPYLYKRYSSEIDAMNAENSKAE